MIEPRKLLGLIPHGLYLIGVQTASDRFIYTGSWLTQASFEPCLIVTAVRRSQPGNAMIQEAGTFAVNFLSTGQLDLARVGFGNPDDRFASLEWKRCPETGAPVVLDAIGYIGCRLVQWIEGGDHDLAVAEAVIAERFRGGELLTIHDTPWTYS
jgi:flavin reductase (DIM6/NTAB) family NADH-FMN oxidoreductase RutF